MEQRIQIQSKSKPDSLQTIIWAGVVVGILDGVATSILLNIKLGLNPGQVMQYVASALFGPSALADGVPMILIGTLLHFMIATITAAIYFFACQKIRILNNYPVLSGLALGLGAWFVMNVLVVPLSRSQPISFGVGEIAISITCHLLLVGLPISLIIKRHFDKQV
jgi:hypothetical protein